jgi:type VI secretion system secreted protein Hcp
MAMPFYLEIKEYPGSVDQTGREGWILCEALEHTITIPMDRQTGTPAGLRRHHPFTITKTFDKSSPGLEKALCTGQNLKEAVFRFFRIDPTGVEELYYVITLRNVRIESIHSYVRNCLLPEFESLTHMEEVSFFYSTIEWYWVPDSVIEMDEWRSRPM